MSEQKPAQDAERVSFLETMYAKYLELAEVEVLDKKCIAELEERVRQQATTIQALEAMLKIQESGSTILQVNKDLHERIAELEAKLTKFKVWGTDGCRGEGDTCQGRITLFITSDRCLGCERKALEGAGGES